MTADTTSQAAKFLRDAHNGPPVWRNLCLRLQREARGLPAIYPSALAAQNATPEEDRVYRAKDLKRGMVAYFDDINDSNPYGHIVFVIGSDKQGELICWTNDALRTGGVDVVRMDWFQQHWGDVFQFGATSLNGYDLPEFDEPPKPKPGRGTLGANFAHAIADVEKALSIHERKGHDAIVRVLKRDLARMQKHAARFS